MALIYAVAATAAGDTAQVPISLVLIGLVAVGVVAYMTRHRRLSREVETLNEADFHVAKRLGKALDAVAATAADRRSSSDAYERFDGLVLGEIDRHFDRQMEAEIDGYLRHDLWFSGGGVSIGIGSPRASVSLGVGHLGLEGYSTATFSLSGTIRDNLMGDGFVAVFETAGSGNAPDVVRVVVPPEPAIRNFVSLALDAMADVFPEGSHSRQAIVARNAALVSAPSIQVTYSSDRLGALLRRPVEVRSPVHVEGIRFSPHAVLATALRIGAEEEWHPLFPAGYLQRVYSVVAEESPSLP